MLLWQALFTNIALLEMSYFLISENGRSRTENIEKYRTTFVLTFITHLKQLYEKAKTTWLFVAAYERQISCFWQENYMKQLKNW